MLHVADVLVVESEGMIVLVFLVIDVTYVPWAFIDVVAHIVDVMPHVVIPVDVLAPVDGVCCY